MVMAMIMVMVLVIVYFLFFSGGHGVGFSGDGELCAWAREVQIGTYPLVNQIKHIHASLHYTTFYYVTCGDYGDDGKRKRKCEH